MRLFIAKRKNSCNFSPQCTFWFEFKLQLSERRSTNSNKCCWIIMSSTVPTQLHILYTSNWYVPHALLRISNSILNHRLAQIANERKYFDKLVNLLAKAARKAAELTALARSVDVAFAAVKYRTVEITENDHSFTCFVARRYFQREFLGQAMHPSSNVRFQYLRLKKRTTS